MSNLQQSIEWNSDPELYRIIREHLYTPVVGDVLDAHGLFHRFLPQPVQSILKGMKVVGRAMPMLMIDVHGEQDQPFGRLTEALDKSGRAKWLSPQAEECAAPTGGRF